VTLKSLVTGVAAAAVVGGAAAGVTSIASSAPSATPAVQPVVFDAPLPLQPPAGAPTVGELRALLDGLANPNVPFRGKAGLVEGGVGIIEGRTADRLVANAVQKGYFPLSFAIGEPLLNPDGSATATVTASGPQLTPTTQTVTFVNQGGWKLSRSSGLSLLQSALA
jgi:hypothetical protein